MIGRVRIDDEWRDEQRTGYVAIGAIRTGLFLVGCGLIVGVVLILWDRSDMTEIRLSDGRLFRIEAVTFGTNHQRLVAVSAAKDFAGPHHSVPRPHAWPIPWFNQAPRLGGVGSCL